MYRPIAPTPPSAPPSAPNQQPASASTSTSAQDPELDRRNTIALAKRKQRALSRRERSLAFLDDKWKCSDWLPADVRAGLASKRLRDQANHRVQQAQDAHIKAAATIAQLRGQQAAFKISETTSKQYIQDLRDDLDHYYEEEDEGRRPVKRRRSLIIDRVKQDHYNHLAETEEHCLKALPEDTDLSAEIAAASRIDTDAATVLADAKAHLSSIEQMWEAKMVWDEALKAKIKYVTIQQKMKELEDEMATACDDWHNKRDAADEWVKVAEDQGWNVLLDETEM
ncbi:hypothetical protein ACHAPI_011676 [Fusarium lateritium]